MRDSTKIDIQQVPQGIDTNLTGSGLIDSLQVDSLQVDSVIVDTTLTDVLIFQSRTARYCGLPSYG